MAEAVSMPGGRSNAGGNRGGLRRILQVAVIALGVLALVEVVFYLLIAPGLQIKRVEVQSQVELSHSRLLELAGLEGKTYYYSVDPETVRLNLESYPAIRKAFVAKSFPDTLHIEVYRRTPLARAFSRDGEGRVVPLVFDKSGMIYKTGRAVGEIDAPVITGLQFSTIQAGTVLPEKLMPVLSGLESLRENSPELYGNISEVRIMRKPSDHFELMLYPMDRKIPLLLDSSFSSEQIQYGLLSIDIAEQHGYAGSLRYVDLRTGTIVYREKEGEDLAF
ncbi:MAG: FtsQ-type POTRA domain-containing protein [Spirochaetales bacterium]|nr:FtsQ-type POTRA domain-containing protein [Spirochaetales bacterium]MCF7937629.1 FtsQ-type POTRA domain-containing protein [Spirochaetales bacterium]